MTRDVIGLAREAGLVERDHDNIEVVTLDDLPKLAALVAAREREALLVEMRSGEVQLPMQVAARWPSVPGSHKYAGAGGCQPGSFGADSEDLFTTAQLLDYGDRRAAAAIRALNTEGEGNDRP